MGQPQPHPYTHNTVDNKSALQLIISWWSGSNLTRVEISGSDSGLRGLLVNMANR